MILWRYITKEIYTHLLAILIVLLLIFITNQVSHLLDFAGKGLISMMTVLKITLLYVPLLAGYLLPMSFFLAVMVVLGRLYMDSEMTVLYACGFSKARLTMIVLFFGALVALFDLSIMFWIEPKIETTREMIYQRSLSEVSVTKLIPRRFQSLGTRGAFYAESIDRNRGAMKNVFLAVDIPASGTQPESWDITVAKSARDVHDSFYGHYVELLEGKRYVGMPGRKNYYETDFKEYGVVLLPRALKIHMNALEASSKSLWNAYHKDPASAAMIQWRLAFPISLLIFALMAVPLSKVNPRQGKFGKLIPAFVIYIFYADLIYMSRSWISSGRLNIDLGMWWLHGLMMLLALILFLQFVGWRQAIRSVWRRNAAT